MKAGGEWDNRGWDGWMASLTQWTWVWVNSGSWWWIGKPGVLQPIGLQRVRHDWATEMNHLILFLSYSNYVTLTKKKKKGKKKRIDQIKAYLKDHPLLCILPLIMTSFPSSLLREWTVIFQGVSSVPTCCLGGPLGLEEDAEKIRKKQIWRISH